jgi:hypothetical protein
MRATKKTPAKIVVLTAGLTTSYLDAGPRILERPGG